jgi:CdiI immunity protein
VDWWQWLNVVVDVLLVVLVAAWLWARRSERRERKAAGRTREQRLAEWRLVEWPEPPRTSPEPGTTRLDPALASHLERSDDFERLGQLLGLYPHQDFDLEFDDEADAVRAYVQGYAHRPEVVVELLHAMDTLLALGLSDADLKRALAVLGSDSHPLTETTVWLRTLRAQVLAEARGD